MKEKHRRDHKNANTRKCTQTHTHTLTTSNGCDTSFTHRNCWRNTETKTSRLQLGKLNERKRMACFEILHSKANILWQRRLWRDLIAQKRTQPNRRKEKNAVFFTMGIMVARHYIKVHKNAIWKWAVRLISYSDCVCTHTRPRSRSRTHTNVLWCPIDVWRSGNVSNDLFYSDDDDDDDRRHIFK